MAFSYRENNSRALDGFESEGTRGADGRSHLTQEDKGQINGYEYCTQQQNNGEHYTTGEGAEQDSGPSMGTGVEDNGLCHLPEADTGQTKGSGCTTQKHRLHSGGIRSRNEGSSGQTNRTGQANGLGNTPIKRGDGQTKVFSCLTNEDGDQTNDMSGTEEISRQPDGLINAVRPNDQINEMSYPTGRRQAPLDGVSHTTDECTWQTNDVGNLMEERSGQESGLHNSHVGCGAKASGWSQPTDDRGSNYQPDEATANEVLPRPVQEDVTCFPVQENNRGDATLQRSIRQRNQFPCLQVSGRFPVGFQIRGAGQVDTRQPTFFHQQIDDMRHLFNAVSATGDIGQAVEQTCSAQEINLWNHKLNRSYPQKASRKKGNTSGTFFIMEVSEVHQHRQHEIPIVSGAIATDSYEYLLGIRMFPNGVDGGKGTHVALFVHMIQGVFDDLLDWPFAGRITVSIIDQSGAEIRSHISRIVQAKPNLYAFQKPAETICRTGYGFVKFAPIQEVFSPRYVKNDKLFVKIEFSY